MDLLKLRQLACIIRHRSFSEAAEMLGVSQSALSKNIRALERETGVQLLERGRFGATPTPFGVVLARHADAVDAELRTATSELAALKAARTGSITIGCGPSEASRLLPMALKRLHKRAPRLRVTVLYGLNEALVPMVRHGEVDFSLSSIPAFSDDADLRRIALYEDTAAVIARAGHPLLALRKPLTPTQLVGYEWVLARRKELERRALDDLFIAARIAPPEASIETTSATLMQTIVMQSDFLTFLPRELIYWQERSRQLQALNVTAPSWRRTVGVTLRTRAASSPAITAMIEELQRAAREIQ
jgi:LysR family transcriptional regulator, pca operon transcriptional activator